MAMGQMAASMAHEIRNPLGGIELFCTLLKKDLKDLPEQLKLAEQMHESIRALNQIITNCLEFTRDRNANRQTIQSVTPLLENIVHDVTPRAQAKNVSVAIEAIGERPVFIDRYLIKQAILNLMLNAIDAAAENGEVEPVVRLTSNLEDSTAWKLTVEDNGNGISEEARARIFEPFYTTKQEGTGLGLAIVHSLVSSHDGSISISSEIGKGTQVLVSIPLEKVTTTGANTNLACEGSTQAQQ